jgi:hypothetical protein
MQKGKKRKNSGGLLTGALSGIRSEDVSPAERPGVDRTKEANHRYTTDERTPELVGLWISAHTELGGPDSTFELIPQNTR